MSRWWDSAAVLVAMFCAAEALYTLRREPASFDGALSACLTDGVLTSMASEEENERILSAVSASLKSAGSFHFWVGLLKPAGTCDREDLPLRGFVWTSNNSSSSGVSQWRKTPVGTCTSERCGLLSLDFDGAKVTGWGWTDSTCARRHGFICKSKPPPTDAPVDESPCAVGRTPCGKPQPPSEPPRTRTTAHPSRRPSLSHSTEDDGTTAPSTAPSFTSSSSIVSQIRESTSDKYSIFIPVLVALLVLVVLVVVVLGVLKCCFKKKPNKATHSQNGGSHKPEETLDLTTTDLDRAETTA